MNFSDIDKKTVDKALNKLSDYSKHYLKFCNKKLIEEIENRKCKIYSERISIYLRALNYENIINSNELDILQFYYTHFIID